MMKAAAEILRCRVTCPDGPLGAAHGLLFDDRDWIVRYLTVAAEGDAGGKYVFVSPVAIARYDPAAHELRLRLAREELSGAPAMQAEDRLPRDDEMALTARFGWPSYWADTAELKGAEPQGPAAPAASSGGAGAARLRSLSALRGCEVLDNGQAAVGAVSDAIVETTDWSVRFLAVRIEGHPPPALAAPDWIAQADWEAGTLLFDLPQEAFRTGPVLSGDVQGGGAGRRSRPS
jgi:hypothetical protein